MVETQTKIDESILKQRLSDLEKARSWTPQTVSRLETFVRSADDYALFRVNPFQYAAENGLTPTEAINLFLHATKCGLFEMDWQLVCGYCPQVVNSFRELSKVHSHFVCSFCQAENDVALDDYIQVTFTVSPQIRDNMFLHPGSLSVEDFYFKYSFSRGIKPPPGMTFEKMAEFLHKYIGDIQPKEKQTIELDLPPGRFEMIDLAHNAILLFMVSPGDNAAPQTTVVQLMDGKFNVRNRKVGPREMKLGVATFKFEQVGDLQAGKHVFEIENITDTRGRFWFVEYPHEFQAYYQEYDPFLSGKKLLTTQTFRDLFRTEVISTSEGITVKDITFLFTDLKGSTDLYDKIGDANAYFLVRQHFETLGQAITANSGAIVKTIGDAVMAAFEKPSDAVNAAMMMMEGLRAFNRTISQELILKVGIHRGHSIAVTLNERLDYFGQTVNIAARVQGLADADEVYLTADVYQIPEVQEILKAHHVVDQSVSVKGVSQKLQVHKICFDQA